jgi:hypothetical protein
MTLLLTFDSIHQNTARRRTTTPRHRASPEDLGHQSSTDKVPNLVQAQKLLERNLKVLCTCLPPPSHHLYPAELPKKRERGAGTLQMTFNGSGEEREGK